MNKSKRNKQHKDRRITNVTISPSIRIKPGRWDPNFKITTKRRFIVGAASALTAIPPARLIEAFGLMCTQTNLFATPIFGFIRIKRIQVWGAIANATTPSVASIVWGPQNSLTAPNFSTNVEASDSSSSPEFPAYVSAVPPKGSMASLWQSRLDTAANRRTGMVDTLFSVLTGVTGVVDITAELVAYDVGKGAALGAVTITSGVLGAFAYAPLDGIGGNYVSQGVDSFT
jgi:hypothetical protein